MTTDFDQKIAALQREIEELQKQKLAAESMTEEERLAEFLHKHMCHHNHTDACSWYYEMDHKIHNWSGYAHGQYFDLACRCINARKENNVSEKAMADILKAIFRF